jgi:uncharacterized protein with HEPN domain
MKGDTRKHLIDILQAADEINRFVLGMDLNAYQGNSVTQRAVERDFEIIGEALNRIGKTDEDLLEQISEYRRIIGFRNILIHGYDVIDEKIVWDAIKSRLPVLVQEIRHLLEP